MLRSGIIVSKAGYFRGFPGGLVVKNLASNARDTVSIPGQGTKILHTILCGQKKKKKIFLLGSEGDWNHQVDLLEA